LFFVPFLLAGQNRKGVYMKKFFSKFDTQKTVEGTEENRDRINTPDWRKGLYGENQKSRLDKVIKECDNAIKWLENNKAHLEEYLHIDDKYFKTKKELLRHDLSRLETRGSSKNSENVENYINQAKEILDWRDQLMLRSVDISQYENNIAKGIKKVNDRYEVAYAYISKNMEYANKSVMAIVNYISKVQMLKACADREKDMETLLKFNEKSKVLLEIQFKSQRKKDELSYTGIDYD
jgi:hypothetical protein